jgi:hypothetical protein
MNYQRKICKKLVLEIHRYKIKDKCLDRFMEIHMIAKNHRFSMNKKIETIYM